MVNRPAGRIAETRGRRPRHSDQKVAETFLRCMSISATARELGYKPHVLSAMIHGRRRPGVRRHLLAGKLDALEELHTLHLAGLRRAYDKALSILDSAVDDATALAAVNTLRGLAETLNRIISGPPRHLDAELARNLLAADVAARLVAVAREVLPPAEAARLADAIAQPRRTVYEAEKSVLQLQNTNTRRPS